MGNSIGKDKGEETVDGGQLTPHGVYKGTQDWDYRSVRKLIIERKLAPFYKGLPDYDEGWNDVTLTTHNLPKNGEVNQTVAFSNESISQGSGETKRSATLNTVGTTKGKEVPTSKSLEAQLYKGAVECPICFLYYPRNINYSRCCDQPICTECFVQIKRPESGTLSANNSPAVCPFCVQPNFGICYKPPSFIAGIGSESSSSTSSNTNNLIPTPSSTTSLDGRARRKSVSHKNPDVVTTDQIRPDWATRVLQPPRQPPSTRRSSTTTSGNSRRIPARHGGGGSSYMTSSTTNPSRRNNQPAGGDYGGYLAAMRMGTDLEELMDENSNNISSSDGSTTGTITSPNLSNLLDEINRIDNSLSEVEILTSRQELLENAGGEDGSSSISHSHDHISTTVSTLITSSAEYDTITSVSAPSSRGTGPSTPSSTTNSTNEAIITP
ncbi:9396_t:CDS:2, partial [Funneliformis caledonium]